MQKEKVPTELEVARNRSDSGDSDVLVLTFETANKVLTSKRQELIHTIENQDVKSVTHLSELVDRDSGRVSKDLKKLFKADIVEFEENSGSKVPRLKHDVLDIEPIVLRNE